VTEVHPRGRESRAGDAEARPASPMWIGYAIADMTIAVSAPSPAVEIHL
jgi:hypothetical protein